MLGLTATERELERIDNVIKAAEDWSEQYSADTDTHGKLIKIETRMETLLRRYFRELSDRAVGYVSWMAYNTRLSAISAADDFKIEVLIADDFVGAEDAIFIQTMYDPMAQAVALGAIAGENLYSVDLGISETSLVVQKTARRLVGGLVGKRIDENGNIIDNPKAKYRISDKTRDDIRQSLSTSLALGENQAEATTRLLKTIKNPRRAATIARTEAVNGYQEGLLAMGNESGAVGKEWQSVNPNDICGTNAAQGIIDIGKAFASGDMAPAAHPNCRCGMRLVYPEELN